MSFLERFMINLQGGDGSDKLLKHFLSACSLGFSGLWLGLAFLRSSYPYELEWMEGGIAAHVQRVLEGLPLYSAPSLEFTPFIYTPLYYYLVAGLSFVSESDFFVMRLVSALSSLGIFLLIFLFVKRETSSGFYGLISAGLFSACYAVSGYWFDIARPDMLFLWLYMAGLYVLRGEKGWKSDSVASFLLVLAFFTKQTALMPTLPLILYTLLFRRGWSRMVFPASYAVLVAGGCLLADRVSEGWFSFYVFTLPKSHPIFYSKIVTFWIFDLAPILLLPLISAAWIILSGLTKRSFKDAFFWLMLFGGLVGAAWFSRIHSGGWINVLTPAFLGLSLFWGVGLKRWFDEMNDDPKGRLVLFTLILIQFSLLVYNPVEALPSDADRTSGDRLVEVLQSHENVFIPHHPYLAEMAGLPKQAHQMALVDVIRADVPEGLALRNQLIESLASYDAVYLSEPWLLGEVEKEFIPTISPFSGREDFVPVTGVPLRPELVFLKTHPSP